MDALDALAGKRENIEGASLFMVLSKRRDRRLLRLLVAYQTMWDFLDNVSERGAGAGHRNGWQLHRALVEALDPSVPISDYYKYHPWKEDAGYLFALVSTCRRLCAGLPSYRLVRRPMLEGARLCGVQAFNHEPDPARRDALLKAWVEEEVHELEEPLSWFERAAAASAFTPYAFLALAAKPACEPGEVQAVRTAYFPWVSLSIAMLDSYADSTLDCLSGSHSYIAHYISEENAVNRLQEIVKRTVSEVAALSDGNRHLVIASSMVAMYLSSTSTAVGKRRLQADSLARAGGSMTRLLLPAARFWRKKILACPRPSRLHGRLPPCAPVPEPLQTYLMWTAPFSYMKRCANRYGGRFTLRMVGSPPLVFLSDRSEVKALLSAPADALHPGEGGEKIAPIVGEGSFMLLDGEAHLSGRRAVLPAFRRELLERESDWLEQKLRRAVTAWPRGAPIQLHARLRTLTLEVILRRIFGGQAPEERLAALRDRVLAMLTVTGSVVLPVPALRRGPGRRIWERFVRDRSRVDEAIHRLIDERLEGNVADACESEDGNDGGGREDALAMLLRARPDGAHFGRTQLRDNVMSLILAGHETTASQLAWAFQLLAHNPRVQRRLIGEIDDPAAGDEYLSATVQEVLRHRPVFLFAIPRAVKRPIEIGDRIYEPPVHLLACIYLLHHDPEVYPDPDRFRPERFLEGQPGPYAWLPWGGGRKRCPGSRLASIEIQAVLRATLESVTIAPASKRIERPRWRSVVVTPHRGSRVVLCPRERVGTPRRRRQASPRTGCPAAQTRLLGPET